MKLLLLVVDLRLTVIGITRFFGFSIDCSCNFASLVCASGVLWSAGKSVLEIFDKFPLFRLPPEVRMKNLLDDVWKCLTKEEDERKLC